MPFGFLPESAFTFTGIPRRVARSYLQLAFSCPLQPNVEASFLASARESGVPLAPMVGEKAAGNNWSAGNMLTSPKSITASTEMLIATRKTNTQVELLVGHPLLRAACNIVFFLLSLLFPTST
jgi:hypothetical protein